MSNIACGAGCRAMHLGSCFCCILPALEKDMDLASELSASEENFGMPQLRMAN